jgi:hypothetical protein
MFRSQATLCCHISIATPFMMRLAAREAQKSFYARASNEGESFEGARLNRDKGPWRGPSVEDRQAEATHLNLRKSFYDVLECLDLIDFFPSKLGFVSTEMPVGGCL